MKKIYQSVGPALIVAAVVLGPGSILTSSRVGSNLGLVGFPIVMGAAILMIGMVALSARLGAVYPRSLCDELSSRLGRPVSVLIGVTLFTLVAFFQSSNNIALIAGLEPLLVRKSDAPLKSSLDVALKASDKPELSTEVTFKTKSDGLGFGTRASLLVFTNLLIIGSLYLTRNLYKLVETGMKILIGLMTVAFLINFVVVFIRPRGYIPDSSGNELEWLPLLGMIGTTFSVGGAFYQAYLVKEKGWGVKDVKQGLTDSIISISLLGSITAIILLTSWRVFYGNPGFAGFSDVGDVAAQLEPSFGSAAKIIFCAGILAGALSSFLVNALIGGTVMADSIGKGSRLKDPWTIHLTSLALLVGMAVGIASLYRKESTVHLITLAQALTVLGIPALAAALIYLGTRPELEKENRVPKPILVVAIIGFLISIVLAAITASKVSKALAPKDNQAARSIPVEPDAPGSCRMTSERS